MMIGYIQNEGDKGVLCIIRPGQSDLRLQTYSSCERAMELGPKYVEKRFKQPLVWANDITSSITSLQRMKLERLWFIFGNHGPKHTHAGHRYIQCILEQGEDTRSFFRPDREVLDAVTEVLYATKVE